MTDLIINFDTETQTSKRTHIHITPGSWTHRLKQKRKARYLDRKKANHPPALPAESKDPDSTKAPKVEKRKKLSKDEPLSDGVERDDTLAAGTATGPRKKIRLEAKAAPSNPPGKIQVISSLFSSTIIPTIKSPSTSDQPTLTVYAPSNASLSDIDIASPSLSLHPQISNHLSSSPKLGQIRSPTGIQSIAWPVLTAQSNNLTRDVIIQSQTGSGKTLAYLVPIIQDLLTLASGQSGKVWTREVGTLAIVLVPTRELAEQVYNVAISLLAFARAGGCQSKDEESTEIETENHTNEFGSEKQPHSDGLNPRWLVPGTLHGGTNRTHEKARLRRGLPLLVCTPGRLLDHLEKTASLRMAGEPVASINDHSNKKKEAQVDGLRNGMGIENLSLRWLVVDEADRLMDMGFEEQMRGILKHLTEREAKTCEQANPASCPKNGRRTVLCSATMPDGVKKLVGLTLNDPIILKAAQPSESQSEDSPEDATSHQEQTTFSAPSQLTQHYVIAPPKLRLVSLLALLRHITKQNQKKPAEKVLVFMSCTASVDFHFEAVSATSFGRPDEFPGRTKTKAEDDETDEEPSPIMKHSSLLPGVKIFRLHGNLDLQTRLASLNAFSKSNAPGEPASSSILLCTSLAGRGLDVPFVSHVIQYDLPTEGGVTEYLHRVGRTARAGQDGQAWSFLLPSEEGWVKWCEANQRDNAGSAKLREVGVQKLLQDGYGGKCQKDWETRATDAQMAIERWVISSPENTSLASTGFSSHIRAYATHPSQEKRFFHVKNLHLGHLAKAFGLREAPKHISTSNSSNQAPQAKSKRSAKQANRKNLDRGSDDDEEGTFEALSQFKHKKNGNVLRGPIANGVDEFNVGDVSQLLAARR